MLPLQIDVICNQEKKRLMSQRHLAEAALCRHQPGDRSGAWKQDRELFLREVMIVGQNLGDAEAPQRNH
jgi:hypothetical protein